MPQSRSLIGQSLFILSYVVVFSCRIILSPEPYGSIQIYNLFQQDISALLTSLYRRFLKPRFQSWDAVGFFCGKTWYMRVVRQRIADFGIYCCRDTEDLQSLVFRCSPSSLAVKSYPSRTARRATLLRFEMHDSSFMLSIHNF